jgi:hypothetical protein
MWESAFRELAEVAGRQHGLITTAQMARTGAGDSAVRHLVAEQLLTELDWSVFQLAGSSVAPRSAYPLAAWLALRPESFAWERPQAIEDDAVLSHESACQLWGLGSVGSPSVVFTSPHELALPRAVEVRVARLTAAEVTRHHAVPVTTPQRIIVDLITGWNDHDEVRRALSEAVRRDLVDLMVVYRDLVPIAERHQLPVGGPEFAGYLLTELDVAALSLRNQHAYAVLVSGTPNLTVTGLR